MTAVEFLVDELNKEMGLISFVTGTEESYKSAIFSIIQKAKANEKEKEEQYNNMLSMLQETYRRLEHTDMISLRKQIKEVLTFKSE